MKRRQIAINLVYYILLCFILVNPIYLESKTFTVTNTLDKGPGSFRTAINLSNDKKGMDTINFNIVPAEKPATIRPLSQLPMLTDRAGVLIDGFSQGGVPGSNPPASAMLLLELNGSAAGKSHGLWITSPNNTIQGMVIDSFEQDGIRIEGTPDTTYNNYIYCNFIGTDMGGFIPRGNGWNNLSPWAGVNIVVGPGDTSFACNNIVEGNICSGNYARGVSISSCPPGDNHSNLIIKNHLGADIMGLSPLGNSCNGVYIGDGAHHNILDSNLISDNRTEGVCIIGYVNEIENIYWYTTDNIVSNNIIGLAVDKVTPMGNLREGISIGFCYGTGSPVEDFGYATTNTIGENNIIAHNDHNGIIIWEHQSSDTNADGNKITKNSIYSNGISASSGLGIDLDNDGLTLNDEGDLDALPNQDLNFPVIDSAINIEGETTIYGHIDIDSDPLQAVVEVFLAKVDPSGYGEGQQFLGSTTPFNASGDWNLLVSGLNVGDTITATTSDIDLNTSEFSLNYVVSTGSATADETSSTENLLKVSPYLFVNSVEISFKVKNREGVRVDIYDLSGKLIKPLVNEILNPSIYSVSWDGTNINGIIMPAGIYLCNFETPSIRTSKKLTKID
jgi:hypothetical protein